MATTRGAHTVDNAGVGRWFWEGLVNGNEGEPAVTAGFTDLTVQISGDDGGGTVVLQGSNDGTTYVTLEDNENNAISVTAAAGPVGVREAPRYIRPALSGGAAGDVDVTLIGYKRR